MSTTRSGIAGANPAARPKRRFFTAEFKRAIVAEYDATPDGGKAAVLRREKLYSSHIIEWRRQVNTGDIASSTAKRTDKARVKAAADAAELAKLRRANARLAAELDKTRSALVVLGKTHALCAP